MMNNQRSFRPRRTWAAFLTVGVLTSLLTGLDSAEAARRKMPDLLVSSYGTGAILRYDGKTGAFKGRFDNPPDLLGGPTGMVFGPDKNLYAGGGNIPNVNRINGRNGKPLPAPGQVGSDFVVGAGELNDPAGLAFGPDGNLYVCSAYNNTIQRYHSETGAYMGAFVSEKGSGLNRPYFPMFGPDGHLYVTNNGDSSILRFDENTGAPRPAAGQSGAVFVPANSGGLSSPDGMVFGPDKNLYVVSQGATNVMRFNGQTGAPLPAPGHKGAIFIEGTGELQNPDGMTFGPDNNLYVVSNANNSVYRYNGRTGASMGVFVKSRSGGLDNPIHVIFMLSKKKRR
jgi:sugar lactone lactonase YvrE